MSKHLPLTAGRALTLSYLWWDIIDVMVSSLSSFFLSFPREVIDILGGVTSGSQASWDVIDLLGCLTDSTPVPMVMLVSLDGGWDVVYILWNRRLIVIVEIVGKVLA